MFNFSKPLPLSIYIHFPWCIQKCPYCDFNSHTLKQNLQEDEYIDKLMCDLEQDLHLVAGRSITSIFLGGGTPSIFSPQSIAKILEFLNTQLNFSDNIEITLEANPGTVEQKRFEGFHAAGINRLSIGIQSFQDAKLVVLGRIHNSGEAQQAVKAAQRAGFNNINLDLMFGLPKQTLSEALADLQIAISLQPTHLSWYQLTLEPNTLFYQQPPALPHDEVIRDIFERGQASLIQAGYQYYEISAYSQDGYTCRHNYNYWEFGDYLGIGAGAHSKLTSIAENKIIRSSKIKHPKNYLEVKDNFIDTQKILEPSEVAFEFMLNALRLNKAIPVELFIERTGLPLSIIQNQLSRAYELELLHRDELVFRPTELGRKYLNDLQGLFLET